MKGIRELRQRLKAVKNTGKITRAMQLVSASKMKKAQDLALCARPYILLLTYMLHSLRSRVEKIAHPLLEQRPIKCRGIVVVGTDRGLCGALNQNLFRQIKTIEGKALFVSIGKKSAQFLQRNRHEMLASFPGEEAASFRNVRIITELLMQAYTKHTIDTVELLYPCFVNTMVQHAFLRRVLPIISLEKELAQLLDRFHIRAEPFNDERYLLIEPSPQEMANQIPSLFFKQSIYQILLECRASEHSARMVAMKNATDNANQLIENLTLLHNKARQSSITNEILEIATSQQQK